MYKMKENDNNNLMIFEGNKVEVFEYEGKVLFNPRNVGECLGLSYITVRRHLQDFNDSQKIKLRNSNVLNLNFRKIHNTGEIFLTESGVYRLIFHAKTPGSLRFQDWVTDEVLPQIRQTGGYIPVKQEETNEEFLARAFLIAQETIQKKDKIIELQKPKVDYFDKVLDASKLIDVSEIAKGLGMTATRLNSILCELGVQYKKTNRYGKKVGTWKLKSDYDYLVLDGYVDYHIYANENAPQVLKWTEKGRKWIIDLLEVNNIL